MVQKINGGQPTVLQLCQMHEETIKNLVAQMGDLKTSVLLLEQDAKTRQTQLTQVIAKLDAAADKFQILLLTATESTGRQTAQLDAIHKTLEDFQKKQDGLDASITKWHDDQRLLVSESTFKAAVARIQKLENWRWRIVGGAAAVGAIIATLFDFVAQWVAARGK
jgi:hypothetical protein